MGDYIEKDGKRIAGYHPDNCKVVVNGDEIHVVVKSGDKDFTVLMFSKVNAEKFARNILKEVGLE